MLCGQSFKKTGSNRNSGILCVPIAAASSVQTSRLSTQVESFGAGIKLGNLLLKILARALCSNPLPLFRTYQLGFRQAIRATLSLLTWDNRCGAASTSCFKVSGPMLAKLKRAQQLAALE